MRPVKGQVDDLLAEIKLRAERDERVLVTTPNQKRWQRIYRLPREMGVRIRYLHSEVETFERVEILRNMRLGYSMYWLALTSCGKVWICRRFPWLPFWMQTKKAFSALKPR